MKAPPRSSVPRHVAIILDGNGRWARQRGLERVFGHEEGAQAVRQCIEGCGEVGVDFLTLYAFSQENWQRPKTEVIALMALLRRFLRDNTAELVGKNVRLRAIGRLADLPADCLRELDRAVAATAHGTGLTLILALSYGARQEIVDSVQSLLAEIEAGRLTRAGVTVDTISQHLYTSAYPDPDLLIRTSGEMRLSNFLLWQLSYTEIYFTKKLWPDFRKGDLLEAFAEYSNRRRRYGSL